MTARRSAPLALFGVLIGALLAPAIATAASAHDALVAADPASGATVTSLARVALTFSADPIGGEGADIVQVVGPDGRYYETGCPTLAGPVVTAPVAAGPAGTYTVEWRIVSSDGHPVADEYTFTYEPVAGATAAEGSATPRCGAAEAPATEPGPAAPDAGLLIGLGIGVVVVVALALTVWLLVRRPRRRD